jgi:hypothetical protein
MAAARAALLDELTPKDWEEAAAGFGDAGLANQ